MIISEKQIFELMNVARYALSITYNDFMRHKIMRLIYEIEQQQSNELEEIKCNTTGK